MNDYKPQSVNKFYFLDYFYILLESVNKFSDLDNIFESFKSLKREYNLGESKYKKLTVENEPQSEKRINSYFYTFKKIIAECLIYKIIKQSENKFFLTKEGNILLNKYDKNNPWKFYNSLIPFMEEHYGAIRYFIDFSYKANEKSGGLLIFPFYSPSKLDIVKSEIKTTADFIRYSKKLKEKLETDLQKYLGKKWNLSDYNKDILNRLMHSGILPAQKSSKFLSKDYTNIVKRFRDFWLNTFLKEIYGYNYSLISFYIWSYRFKQIGILHITEFYPGFHGRIFYPTSIITNNIKSSDFVELYKYMDNKSLYMHAPSHNKDKNMEIFAKSLTDSYLDIRETNRNYFINLADLKERVCYKMKIASLLFDKYLEAAYKLKLQNKLNIDISLEADRLPQETKAVYLKREPVIIDGKYKNIIAIDIAKGDKRYDGYTKSS